MHENIHAPSILFRDITVAVEVFYRAAEVSGKPARINLSQQTDSAFAGLHRFPRRLHIVSDRANKPKSRYHNASFTHRLAPKVITSETQKLLEISLE